MTAVVDECVVSTDRASTPSMAAVVPDRLEIRMLGSFQVRRKDGSAVDPKEWRTAKVADLLRLLALRADEPVPAHVLVGALWPGSDARRGHSSLRTAISMLRRVVGAECLQRSLAGIRLFDVWVDVAAFREMAGTVDRLAATGDLQAALTVARDADALHRGEFRAQDDSAEWAQSERRSLAGIYQALLCDASGAAAGLGHGREAVDFAARALAVDPFSERASRLLMRAHAEVGDISLALREYERCRNLLAEELGVDPSPETQEVHLSLLCSQPEIVAASDRRVRPDEPLRVSAAPQGNPAETADDPQLVQAESRLQMAVTVCLPHRQFARAHRYADEATGLSDSPAIRARAVVAAWLPDVLLGRARAARAPLAAAAELTERLDDRVVRGRLDILRCLAAHDLASADFPSLWTLAASRCEVDVDVNWAWAMMRIATERGDLRTARVAQQLPTAPASGPLARQLHLLSCAVLRAECGETASAIEQLQSLAETLTRAENRLLLPETLARLVAVQADRDPGGAEANLSRLDLVLNGQRPFPRELYLRLVALAAVQSARGRAAAAASAAARAAEVADVNGLVFLASRAHDLCARYTSRAQSAAARTGGVGELGLRLSVVSA